MRTPSVQQKRVSLFSYKSTIRTFVQTVVEMGLNGNWPKLCATNTDLYFFFSVSSLSLGRKTRHPEFKTNSAHKIGHKMK